jgi:uncharacterized protein
MYSSVAAPDRPVQVISPTAEKDRISILDSLRGFAILGILLMNIGSFALPGISHDPVVLSETGINYYTWYFVELVPAGTQRALFSMLFGAGIILFVRSAEKKVEGIRAADYFFRRQLWLLVFSLFDVFVLLWMGDILLDYALFGMLIFTFRNLSPKALFVCAAFSLLFMLARENRDLYQRKSIIERGEAIAQMDTSLIKLNPSQKEVLGRMEQLKKRSLPEVRLERTRDMQFKVGGSSYGDLYEFRTNQYVDSLVQYVFFDLWDVLLFMFLGMAFFKTGILTGKASARLYALMGFGGLGIGIFLTYLFLQPHINSGFNRFEYLKSVDMEYYQLGRALRSIGIFGCIMLLYRSGLFNWLFAFMRPVGQMAFTNYLSQSLICGIIFYSVGFAMYGKMERYEIYIIVAAIWIFQIIFSNIWLKYYRFGPFEWAWRSLTYWKRQPMKRV